MPTIPVLKSRFRLPGALPLTACEALRDWTGPDVYPWAVEGRTSPIHQWHAGRLFMRLDDAVAFETALKGPRPTGEITRIRAR